MTKQAGKLPTAAEIIQFLSKLEGQPASKREIAKEFRIKGQEARVDLKFLLKDISYHMKNDIISKCVGLILNKNPT